MRTVLVIEDNAEVRRVVVDFLAEAGYEVAQAENGAVALDVLAEMAKPPCLVLLDCMMPVMNGPEFMEVVRAGHRLAPLPIVVMSGTAGEDELPGAQRYLRKPLPLLSLLKVVEEYCGVVCRPELHDEEQQRWVPS
jgi:CheY-like chemotaxis protein